MTLTMTARTKLLSYGLAITLLLAIPLIAMQFTSEVNWKPNDFGIAALLLLAMATAIELARYFIKQNRIKRFIIALIVIMLVLIWIELAVGIFNSPLAGH
jgi:hypothetical protein